MLYVLIYYFQDCLAGLLALGVKAFPLDTQIGLNIK